MSAPFHFKKFSITQDHAPMKVGTDGVLLGAWVDVSSATHILDIGTGTGLIALMLAQRNPAARIVALERNASACADARHNFDHSPFADRITLVENSLRSYEPQASFDLIISNPPFFKGSLHNPSPGRTEARHEQGFSTGDFAQTIHWLSPQGILAGIYPTDVHEVFHQEMTGLGCMLRQKCRVQPTPSKKSHRVLFTYGAHGEKQVIKEDTLIIEENGRHNYSEAYQRLTEDFYLDKGKPI